MLVGQLERKMNYNNARSATPAGYSSPSYRASSVGACGHGEAGSNKMADSCSAICNETASFPFSRWVSSSGSGTSTTKSSYIVLPTNYSYNEKLSRPRNTSSARPRVQLRANDE